MTPKSEKPLFFRHAEALPLLQVERSIYPISR
jgi:hypothetical protein